MQQIHIPHVVIVILLMVITGLAVYIIVTPTVTAPVISTSVDTIPTTPPAVTTPEPTDESTRPGVAEPATTENPLANTKWNWQGTNGPGRSTLTSVAARNPFILNLSADGRASSATDCNSMSGSYTVDNHTLSFGDFAMTMMYCEGSQESTYSEQLGQVERFTMTDDVLELHLAANAGTMVFKRVN